MRLTPAQIIDGRASLNSISLDDLRLVGKCGAPVGGSSSTSDWFEQLGLIKRIPRSAKWRLTAVGQRLLKSKNISWR